MVGLGVELEVEGVELTYELASGESVDASLGQPLFLGGIGMVLISPQDLDLELEKAQELKPELTSDDNRCSTPFAGTSTSRRATAGASAGARASSITR